MTKPGLTFQEHGEIGDKLQIARDTIVEIAPLLSKKYHKGSRLYEMAVDASNKIDKLRFALADYAQIEHFETEGVNGLDIYQRLNLKK